MATSYMAQTWFEMAQFRKRSMDASAWIPLYAVERAEHKGKYGHAGYREDFFGCGTVSISLEHREAVTKIGWSDLGIGRTFRGGIENGAYIPSDEFHPWNVEGMKGTHLVMVQESNGQRQGEWFINPDLLLTLGLYQEGNVWLCPAEGYVEVIKLHRDTTGRKTKLEIKAEFLKDYLCARGLGLWSTWYRERDEIQEDASYLTWPETEISESAANMRWSGRKIEIHEGSGNPFGSQAAVFHITRTDVDFDEDVPEIEVPGSDDGTASTTTVRSFEGRKLYRVLGELWREEWISPSPTSPRVKGDEPATRPTFLVDGSGTREDAIKLRSGGRWLWFRPEVIDTLLSYRDGQLSWYTSKTGEVGADSPGGVTFGMNELGLINVYAKDIAYLPYWQQQVWAGFNVGPDGKVCAELLRSQAVGEPADTQAPEAFLERELCRLDKAIQNEFGIGAFRPHHDTAKIIAKCHRFRATNFDGLLELAKDLARLTADSLEKTELLKKLSPPKGESWGSLKCLEKLIALRVGDELAHKLSGPLFGIYDLRLADAHLATRELDPALKNAGVDQSKPTVIQGEMMLHRFVSALAGMSAAINGEIPRNVR